MTGKSCIFTSLTIEIIQFNKSNISTMRLLISMFLVLTSFVAQAQMSTVEGYVFESNNRGYLNLVKIEVKEVGGSFSKKAITNRDGFFTMEIPQGKDFTVVALKDVFEYTEVEISTKGGKEKVFTKVEMVREPGYLFEVTMAEKYVEGKEEVNAITDARIEIFNNTADTSVLILEKHPNHTFSHTFEQGNHYTVMIRKEGYFTKRLEAFVNVDGCIMCFEGIDEIQPGQPGIADNLTAGHITGTLVANVELEEIVVGEAIKVENIYYSLGKSELREDAFKPLDNLIHLLKNNPSLMVELGSHTDSQGNDESNFKLSSERAQSAVNYIQDNSDIRSGRLQARGYGESKLINGCKNGVKCSDRKHQQNRRTELKVLGITEYDPFSNKTLAQIIQEENFDETLVDIQNQEVVQFAPGEVPDEILAQIEAQAEGNAGAVTNSQVATSRPSKQASPAAPASRPSTPSFAESTNRPSTNRPSTDKPSMGKSSMDKPAMGGHSNSANDSVGENEPEIDLDLNARIPTSNTGASVPDGEFELALDKSYALPNKISTAYSGFVVEFFRSKTHLPSDHLIFQKHGNVRTDELGDGSVSYMVGDFKNKSDAEKFMKHIVSKQYSNAKVISYQKGSRS